MFSEPPLTAFKGVQPDVPWFVRFKTCLITLQAQQPPAVSEALEASLREWEQIRIILTAGEAYGSREQYCLQQSGLWEIYEALERLKMEATISRMIYHRACKVLDLTPPVARPADLTFREGDNLIRKMLAHLQTVAVFYRSALPSTTRQRGAQMIPPSPGFQRTNVLEATTDPTIAEGLWQVFLNDNQYVRTILLGEDVATGATTVDNRLNKPGGGVQPGRGLWIKSYTLLRPKISTWLATALPHNYDLVRCIFISPKGKPVSFLTKSDPLDQANISDGILEANDADDPG